MLNPSFNNSNHQVTFNDIKSLTDEMKTEWNVIIVNVVIMCNIY